MAIRLFTESGLPLLVSSATSPAQFTNKLIEGVVLAINNTSALGNVTLTNFADTLKNNVVPILPFNNQHIAFGAPQDSVKVTGTSLLIQPGFMNKLDDNKPFIDPLTIPQLHAWYDASDLATMFQEITVSSAVTPSNVNDPVGTIFSRTTNSAALCAPSLAGRPILRSNGQQYWLESNNSQRSSLSSGLGIFGGGVISIPFDFMCAMRINQNLSIPGTNNTIFFPGGTGGVTLYSPLVNQLNGGGDGGEFIITTTNAPAGKDLVVTQRRNGLNSRGAIDNGAYATGSDGAISGIFNDLEFFSRNGLDRPSAARIYQYMDFSTTITDDVIVNLRRFMAFKQGRTLLG